MYENQQNMKAAAYQQEVYNQGYAGAVQGQSLGAQTAAGRCTEMDAICNRLATALDQAGNISARLTMIEQRLTGGSTIKPNDAVSPPRPVPNGHIAQMNMGFDELMARFDATATTLSRLGDTV